MTRKYYPTSDKKKHDQAHSELIILGLLQKAPRTIAQILAHPSMAEHKDHKRWVRARLLRLEKESEIYCIPNRRGDVYYISK